MTRTPKTRCAICGQDVNKGRTIPTMTRLCASCEVAESLKGFSFKLPQSKKRGGK